MKELLNRLFHKDGKRAAIATPSDRSAKFYLKHNSDIVGELSLQAGIWEFRYSEDFKSKSHLRPLVQFPEVEKVYQSRVLWPFFASRIPSLRQQVIQEIVRKERIDENDQAKLLRRFGKRTITNPFELFPAV